MVASKDSKLLLSLFMLVTICDAKQKDLPSLNIPQREVCQSEAYKQLSDIIESRIDTSVDPCDDFYGYVCNNYNGPNMVLLDAVLDNDRKIELTIQAINSSDIKPAQQEKVYFTQCVDALTLSNETNAKAQLPSIIIKQLEDVSGVKFPLANGNPQLEMDPKQFGKAIGALYRISTEIQPFFKIEIGENYHDPVLRNALYLSFPGPTNRVTTDLQIDDQTIAQEVEKLTALEELITQVPPTVDFTAVQPVKLDDLTKTMANVIDIPSLFDQLFDGLDEIKEIVNNNDNVAIYERTGLSNIIKLLEDLSNHSITPTTVWNYIYYRVLIDKYNYVQTNGTMKFEAISFQMVASDPSSILTPNVTLEGVVTINVTAFCQFNLPTRFREVHNQVFVRALFPDETERKLAREELSRMTEEIIFAYRSMFEQTSWVTEKSKKNLNKKLDLMIRNILYPDRVFNDTYLLDYYKDLNTNSTDFLDNELAAEAFSCQKELIRLSVKDERSGFTNAAVSNAYYSPGSNSINILAAMLQSPVYRLNWPHAFKYGGYGSVLGHETGHGFDTRGSKYNGTGKLHDILDEETQAGYNKTCDCLIDQYSKFCLNKSGHEQCLGGEFTLAENLADNGGIRASYNAFRSFVNLHGSDPLLPGQLTQQFTEDQLFFVGYGSNWCMNKMLVNIIPADFHSPGPFRVLGPLQNFEAFRAAFNCPAKSKYAPENVCKVWITDVEPNLNN